MVALALPVCASLVAALVGFVVGRRLPAATVTGSRAERADRRDGSDGSDQDVDSRLAASLSTLGSEVAPVWSAQVESSRQQMDTAVDVLTARFAGIVAALDSVLGGSSGAPTYGDESVFHASRERLDEVVHTLNQAVEHKQHTLAALRGLEDHNDQMRQMTAEVGRIAAQTRLLALNAAIEAQRVGAAGAGFGVVASEVRDLAGLSAETGQRIERMVDDVSSAISETLSTAEERSVVEDRMVAAANETVQSVLDDLQGFVGDLRRSSEHLGTTAAGIKDEIAESLVHFQFQDRVGQKLEHVRASIDAFPASLDRALTDGTGVVDTDALLHDLTSTYTMAEEFAAHGLVDVPASTDHDITFF